MSVLAKSNEECSDLCRLKSVLTYVDKECMDLSDKEFIDFS